MKLKRGLGFIAGAAVWSHGVGREKDEDDELYPADGSIENDGGDQFTEEGRAGGDRQDQQESLHARSHHRLECGPDLNKFS